MNARRSRYLDVGLATVLAVMAQLELWLGERYQGMPALPGNRVLTAVLLLGGTVPLAWRRRWPLGVFLATIGSLSLMLLVQGAGEFGGGFLILLVVAYSAGAWGAALWPVLGATAVFLAVYTLRDPNVHTVVDALYPVMFMAVGFIFGRILRQRLRRAVQAEAGTVEAVAAERARLARELHDVVAHSVSVIVMQAKGGSAVLATDPGRAREAFTTIERSGRQALEELRRMLDLLVHDPAAAEDRRAAPGLARLDDLVRATRDAGVDVAVTVDGEPGRLSEVADLSVYRIVQESLTNVVRHAGAAHALVRLRWRADELEVSVRDDGPGVAALDLPSSGRGLVGMRERVAMLGGTLVASPHHDGGFEVCATLPLPETE
ncbi:MAG TPA: sensor histidine kinase [Solirubrobacter sp.]|nr:sensor histidine kinase [Solirubrobacter sp.]